MHVERRVSREAHKADEGQKEGGKGISRQKKFW